MNIKETLQLLDIQEVTTKRQKKNGTREFELPIKDAWTKKKIRVASFASGYVRNQNCASSNYQLNKTKWYKDNNGLMSKERILILSEKDRLKYLISYCLKNYYIGHANYVPNGKYIPKWKFENKIREALLENRTPEVKVIVNGHRYNVI